jgi:hypothetical protein
MVKKLIPVAPEQELIAPNRMLYCAPRIFASARDFGALVNVAQTKGPRTIPFPAGAEGGFASLVPYRKRASWTEWTDESKTGYWNAAP